MVNQEALTIEKLKLLMEGDISPSHNYMYKSTSVRDAEDGQQTVTNHRHTHNRTRCTTLQTTHTKSTKFNPFYGCLIYVFSPILPSDSKGLDGRIASVVYLICLCTAGVVMNLTSWLQRDDQVLGITSNHIDGFLITCILPALLWMAYIFFKQNDRKTVDFINSTQHSNRPLMMGAYVFGTGSSVMDALHISYYLQCSIDLSSLFYSVFKSVFILTQILFLRKFSSAILHKSQSIRLVLFHILGTNICMWFRALFRHADLLFRNTREWKIDKGFVCNEKASPQPILKIWDTTEPYLYPFTMEYSLIAAGLLFNMWSTLRDLNPDPQDIYIYDEMENEHQDAGNEDEEDESYGRTHEAFGDNSSGFYSNTYSPILSRYPSHVSLYSKASTQSMCRACKESTVDDTHEVMDTYKPSADPGLLFGILLSIGLAIAIASLLMDEHSKRVLKVYYIYHIVLHVLLIVALWMMLKGLQTQQSVWYPYNADDMLLIVCFTGMFLYSGLALTAGISELGHVNDGIALLSSIKSGLVVLQSILQVTVVVKSARFQPSFKGLHVDIIRQGALFLVVTNIALWLQDSFFELRDNATTPAQVEFFSERSWKAVTIFAYPFCIFFRFHCAACLFEVWTTFKRS